MHCLFIFQKLQASVVKRQQDGTLLVELFESEGPSLNVQLLNMDCVSLDESLQSLLCSNFASAGFEGSGLSQNQRSSNLPVSSNQSFHVIYQNEQQFFIGNIFYLFLMKFSGVWIADKTLSRVFDLSSHLEQKLISKWRSKTVKI